MYQYDLWYMSLYVGDRVVQLCQYDLWYMSLYVGDRLVQLCQYDLWYMSLCVGDRVVCVPHGHLHTVTYTRSRIDTVDSPDDEHLDARNM